MDICNVKRFPNTLPALKVGIFGRVEGYSPSKIRKGEAKKERRREGVGPPINSLTEQNAEV